MIINPTLHIIVASGYNISVIAGVVLMVLAGLLNRKIAIILSGFVILLYVLLVGAEPAIVRAGIMAGVALIAGFLGREADGLRVLVFTAGLMLLSQPVLLWDIGFQLSFLATLGLILLVPRLDFLDHLIKPVGLVKDIKETTAAQLMVFPVLLFNFQSFSWLGFLVNPLVLWLVPLIMALGLVQITLGWFWPLAKIVAGLNYVVLHSMVVIIKLAAGFGGGEWRIFGLPASFIFVYYGIICLWVFKTRIKSSRRQNKLK
ncbi:ComEC/Rec2 family competence protein [Patescibacteria group bacterium]|nr:ComEC/Rec2 family competence protein [Patescibacteria group bacterium]MBU1931190.1 ComEC/Rec2 family competence protein [Patescibacteria group bacterium]